MRPTFRETLELVRSDMQARCVYEDKCLTKGQIAKFLFNTAVLATLLYRLQVYLHRRGFHALAALVRTINAVLHSVDIDSATEIGPGLLILHAIFICIGPRVTIGRNCILAHQNSILPSPFHEAARAAFPGGPTLGDGVMLGAGACICGEVTIGDRVRVSINAAVDRSFPDDAVLFGVPARMLPAARPAAESM